MIGIIQLFSFYINQRINLRPFQNIFPTSVGIDFSPIFAFMFLGILKKYNLENSLMILAIETSCDETSRRFLMGQKYVQMFFIHKLSTIVAMAV